jgi:hypothetical protein
MRRPPEEIATRRKAFIRKWRLKHRAVADSLEEAGDRLLERRCALAFDPSADKQRRCARVVMKLLPPPARILTAGYGLCRGAEQLMWSAGAA